jgi:cytochrome c oxidase assembly protein subunit 15
MSVGAQPLRRTRGFAISDAAFRWLTMANVVMLIVIVASGATVRLTGSGLGCEHWPGCQPHHFEPRSFHSDIEFGNRVVAFFTILVTLITAIGAWLAPTSRNVRLVAGAIFLGTLAQAPLGAITIHYHLNPWLVMTHFTLSIVVLTLAVALAVELWPRSLDRVPNWVQLGTLLVWVSLCVLLVSGTFATAAGPHPGSVVVRRLWSFYPAVYWHVRATAVFGLSFAVLLVVLARRHSRHLRGALVVLGLLALQMTIGEIQYRTHLPWWLVLVHVTVATTLWAVATAVFYALWRPVRRA